MGPARPTAVGESPHPKRIVKLDVNQGTKRWNYTCNYLDY